MNGEYDAVVAGARCAGSATAMLMARAGMRVLLLDRVHPGRDTLSTHALMRAGVLQLDRWGLLPQISAAGTPAVTTTTFHYVDGAQSVELAEPLYAPRRPVLDTVLFDAAIEAGAEARFGVDVTELTSARSGRVTGLRARLRGGVEMAVRAALTVGADGLRSGVGRAVRAPHDVAGHGGQRNRLRLLAQPPGGHYRWFYRPGGAAGVIPTNDGQVCVWAGLPASRFADERRAGLATLFTRVLTDVAPEAAEIVAGAERIGPLRGFPGEPARLRRAVGTGWALVGDAGSFKDPLTAHGIADALRDAELLARAAIEGSPAAFGAYERSRDALTLPLLRVAEEIAAYDWDTTRIRELLRAESAAMKPEVAALRALDLATWGRAA